MPFPFQNPDRPLQERVDDLVSRMTLDEKISQMVHEAPAIDRLGIPAYNWWNECLHGVARAGVATVFPQAIGLAAAWDDDLMYRIATAISDEARAKHHRFVKLGKRRTFQGLTFWSPNINLFRDPRWGRGQETYGEDPFLSGRLAVAFVKGLQGDDLRYLKTIATVKHYAVHSGPEPERHSFNALADERDLRETYLPQFRAGVVEARVQSVMCAYNRYQGDPCCGSAKLLSAILRDEWGFDGYVVSDCGAITDIYAGHGIVQTSPEAAALAVKAGCDLCCGSEYASLKEAVQKGLILEREIDVAVRRLMTARFRLGQFDPPERVRYARIPYKVVGSKNHRNLALEAARKSIVLLKNEKNLLPLSKTLKSVAVIGPNADDVLSLLGNYYGTPFDPVTPLRGIREKMPSAARVLYARGCDFAQNIPSFQVLASNLLSSQSGGKRIQGLRGDYYADCGFTGTPAFTRVDRVFDFKWFDNAPRKGMDGDAFSVRWTGNLLPVRTGNAFLGTFSTVRYRIVLNDTVVLISDPRRDEFNDPRLRVSRPLSLTAGLPVRLTVEITESTGDAQFNLLWSEPRPDVLDEALNAARQAEAVILCLGLSPRLEGEEMSVNAEGFRGGDRITLDLPLSQKTLLESLCGLGKPVVLVLMSGSPLAVNWANEHVPAILELWYPGQAGGRALADVLFGEANPAGRLPVTFYKSADQLPAFEDYGMKGRTYRFFEGEPLYPFGYGLSYTSFDYQHLRFQPTLGANDTLDLRMDLKNTGPRDGEEVVQVYVSRPSDRAESALPELKGFKRIYLKKGQTSTVRIPIPAERLAAYDDTQKRFVLLPGPYRVLVGASSKDVRMEAMFAVLP